MKQPELFNKTISILVKAYQNGTLDHDDCVACAVGNILSCVEGKFSTPLHYWKGLFYTSGGVQHKNTWDLNETWKDGEREEVLKRIDKSGYNVSELAKIEYSFETAHQGSNTDEWMFNGLMAVVDALMLIHEANTEEVTEAKSLFVKA